MRIHQNICAWFGSMADDPHHRSHSWEHCYEFFQRAKPIGLVAQRDQAALQLGFYLASWGMYRGSSFLLQRAYTVHLGVVDRLADPRFLPLWEKEIGPHESPELAPLLLGLVEGIREAYRPFGQATDTLVTKVILGTLGCLPACDRFFLAGFKCEGFKYSYLNAQFVDRVCSFCRDNLNDLRKEQSTIKLDRGKHYPLMKLVDMYFHAIGSEA